MPDYLRSKVEGGTYFFTVVTHQRLPILISEPARRILHQAWLRASQRHPFETIAVCLLPDHLHTIWRLPEGDTDYSTRWREIKVLFTKGYLREIGPGEARSESRQKRGEAAVWQRRFWEHTICDEDDLEQHLDYIHYNPIKHGYVNRAEDWKWSSFEKFVKAGVYSPDWAGEEGGRLLRLGWE